MFNGSLAEKRSQRVVILHYNFFHFNTRTNEIIKPGRPVALFLFCGRTLPTTCPKNIPVLAYFSPKHFFDTFAAGRFQPKSSSYHVSWQLHNSPGDFARELFRPSKDAANVRVCNEKNFFVLGFGFFVRDVISGG